MVLLLGSLQIGSQCFEVCHVSVHTALPMEVDEREACTAHVSDAQVNARYINDEGNVFANILTNRLFVGVLGGELLLQV